MTFELLKDVSIDYCQRASDGQGQITISYQSNDDVDKICWIFVIGSWLMNLGLIMSVLGLLFLI